MDKEAVLTHIRKSKGTPTLLSGELPASVINSDKYIPALTTETPDYDFPTLDHAISTALSSEKRNVALIGPEGSGKSTALQKLVTDWATEVHLQNFSHVFHFKFRELNSLEGALTLKTFIQHNHHQITPEAIPLVIEKPEDVLFVFDGLDQYQHSLDPSIHALCSDPSQAASVSCLVTSLLQGSLLRGAALVVATRPTENLKFFSGTEVEVLGFLKPQRKAYSNSFFTDPDAAKKALLHMERTLGFYDFCTSPRFCWTVCSIYKHLIDSGAQLPETVTQLFVDVLVHLIQTLSLSRAHSRALVLALCRMASLCFLDEHSICAKEHIDFHVSQQPLTSVNDLLQVFGELESAARTFSFHSQMMQEFILAVAFFMDKLTCESAEEMLKKHEGKAKFLDFFLSGLSEPVQRKPLENLLGIFNSDQIRDYKCWFKSSSKKTLKGLQRDKHYRCFHLLHQAQNESLVQEITVPAAKLSMGHDNPSLQDCVAVNYIFTCFGEMERLGLYNMHFTEEKTEILAAALGRSKEISFSRNSFSRKAISRLASVLSTGVVTYLHLANMEYFDENLKILCVALKGRKLDRLTFEECGVTGACCDDLASVLTSETSQLNILEIRFDDIWDLGFTKLCKAMLSPHCRLQELYMQRCRLTAASMGAFAAALCSDHLKLRKLNLNNNELGDSGMEALCKALQQPLCRLQTLRLYCCDLTAASGSHLKEALMSDSCVLLDMDLSLNELGQEGGLLLCQGLSRPGCALKQLMLIRCELTPAVFKELGSVLKNGTCQLKSLYVGINKVGDHGVKHIWEAVAHPSCLLEKLDVEMNELTDACVEDVCAAIRASKTLKVLDMRNNSLTDASVPAISQAVKDSHIMEQLVLRYNDFSEDVFPILEESHKIEY
ncbi:NACHT, LRR and PYD domains-containing protein 3 isoform 1-T3 [Odontesthes bonariensis]|uniref:NACHT, LRR and PYD domains-containing protein 3 n=1 Tax=Odontesthes bonariensis TaxID=219752 RepID=UPI003F587EF9